MSRRQENIWDAIKIMPEKWSQDPWGNEGGGFWVVAIFGNRVIWYNDIEHGFNVSRYRHHGVIDDYYCDQSDLDEVLLRVAHGIVEGYSVDGGMGPPQPGEYEGT